GIHGAFQVLRPAGNARVHVRPLWQSVLNHETSRSTLVQPALPRRAPPRSWPQTERAAIVGVPSGETAIRQSDSGTRHHARRPARLESAEPTLLQRDRCLLRDVAGQVRVRLIEFSVLDNHLIVE